MSEQQKFTAVVYFHGVGQQSRYEELSRLIESLDDYTMVQEGQHLQQFHAKVEASRSEISDKNVGYVSINRNGKEYRFYEVYWAPLTSTGTTGWSVFTWFIRHIMTPISILRSHWSTRRRWRLSYLYSLWEKHHQDSDDVSALKSLIQLYNDFCDTALRGTNLEGNFKEFQTYIQEQKTANEAELLRLSNQWRGRILRTEWRNFFVFLTIAYITVFIPILTISRMLQFWLGDKRLPDYLPNTLPVMIIWMIGLFLGIFIPLLIARFLRDYGGDVQLWASYQETNQKYLKRQAIVKLGLDSMTHVLNHESCERVLVVAHSLGAPIAYDTLLSIGRHNRAVHQEKVEAISPIENELDNLGTGGGIPSPMRLSKTGRAIPTDTIDYFVTMANPVDKVFYLFESKRGMYRPYELIVDEIRGDIGSAPFTVRGDAPNIQWINFWSQEDYIGGASFSPNPRHFQQKAIKVNNVLIQSHQFPAPARSHVGYFQHNTVIGTVFNLIFEHQAFEQQTDDTASQLQMLLDAKPQKRRQLPLNLMLIASWSLVIAVLADIFTIDFISTPATYILWTLLITLTVMSIVSVARGALHPFKKDA